MICELSAAQYLNPHGNFGRHSPPSEGPSSASKMRSTWLSFHRVPGRLESRSESVIAFTGFGLCNPELQTLSARVRVPQPTYSIVLYCRWQLSTY